MHILISWPDMMLMKVYSKYVICGVLQGLWIKTMFKVYWIALALAQQTYQIELVFPISVTKWSCAMPCPPHTRRFWMWSITYQIRSVPHFSALWTGIQTIGKVNEWEQGFEPTEMEENIQERGLEFSIPNPLSQLLQHNVPRPSLFKLCWISCHVNTRNYLVYYNYDD